MLYKIREECQKSTGSFESFARLASLRQQETHLRETAGVRTSKCPELVALLTREEFLDFRSDTPGKVFELGGQLLQKRTWSMSRVSAPPDCYAELQVELFV